MKARTTKWIENNKQFIKNIAMVICIDSIGIGNDLYLHTTPAFMNNENNKYFRNFLEFEKYLTWNGTRILDNIKRIELNILHRNKTFYYWLFMEIVMI